MAAAGSFGGKMRNSWRVVVIAGVLFIGGAASGARAEVEDVACGSLEHLALGGTESYDETICMAGDIGDLSSGESRRPVGVDVEVIIAYNRATFAIARFDSTNYRTFQETPALVEAMAAANTANQMLTQARDATFPLADLVAGLKAHGDFDISVSAYPEKHPESPDFATDIDMLKRKVDNGATRAITQFFFDNDLYERYVERVRRAGIYVPIVPGILPVHNFTQVASFSTRCGALIPKLARRQSFARIRC